MHRPHAATPALLPRRQATRYLDQIADLSLIHDPAVNVCMLRRPAPRGVADWLRGGGYRAMPAGLHRALLPADGLDDLHRLQGGFPGAQSLSADVALLAEVLLDLVGASHVGVRVEWLDRAMCPRLHVDRVVLRAVCTYLGPGTEWLDDPAADRGLLGVRDGGDARDAPLIRNGDRLHRAQPGEVVLVKGDAWPGNEGNGAIHRSPAREPDGGSRVLLTLDPVW